VPGAYLNAELQPGKYHKMRINKSIAALLMQVDPTSKQYLCEDGTILVEIRRSLYGLPEAAQLWYNYMRGALTSAGYKECPYDPCVFIKKSGNDVSIIAVYVDDCLHVYSSDKMRAELYASLKKANLNDLKVEVLTKDKDISFLGLNIKINEPEGDLSIRQTGYLETILEQYESEIPKGPHLTPCNELIFKPKDTGDLLKPVNVTKYMSKLMRVRYLVRTRPDIELAISVLTTKSRNPTQGDMNRLDTVIRYLASTKTLGLKIRKSDLKIFAYFDAAHAVYENRRSHSGSIFTSGEEGNAVHCKSQIQSIVTTSSTEAELVAVYDDLDRLIWLRRVIEFLGINQGTTVIYQDNTSTITMMYMGRGSSGSNTRHIDIRYFFIKELIDNKTFKIEHLPRENMIADFFASPRVGQAFRKTRDIIMTTL
jgi:hypothetical protein